MANERRGETPFEVEGKSFFLYFGLNELAELESAWGAGREPGEPAAEWDRKAKEFLTRFLMPNTSDLRLIFRVGLARWARLNRNGQGQPDDKAVGEIMDLGIVALREIHAQAKKSTFPMFKDEDEEGRDPNAPSGEPGISTTS